LLAFSMCVLWISTVRILQSSPVSTFKPKYHFCNYLLDYNQILKHGSLFREKNRMDQAIKMPHTKI
jgi:hypothetical protein